MPGVAVVQARHRHQDLQVGGVEIGVPGGIAANIRARAQIAFEQRWKFGRQIIPHGGQRQRATREDTVFQRAQVRVKALVQTCRGASYWGQSDLDSEMSIGSDPNG